MHFQFFIYVHLLTMPKFQPRKTTLRKQSSVGILLSGLERIAVHLHFYATLPDEPLKPWLKFDSVVPPASQVHVDCPFLLEVIFTPVFSGNQLQGKGPRVSTSCSKTLATLSQPIFCTGKIFRLGAILFNPTPCFTAHITSMYCRTCKLLPP